MATEQTPERPTPPGEGFSRTDTRPWPVPIAPEELAAAIFRDADRKLAERLASAESAPDGE
ncbi:MAG: hypothetical protein OXU67_03430 [Chloroflexota bacterium]|nr:hypothetical protein [Chloroflexota bacterium]